MAHVKRAMPMQMRLSLPDFFVKIHSRFHKTLREMVYCVKRRTHLSMTSQEIVTGRPQSFDT